MLSHAMPGKIVLQILVFVELNSPSIRLLASADLQGNIFSEQILPNHIPDMHKLLGDNDAVLAHRFEIIRLYETDQWQWLA